MESSTPTIDLHPLTRVNLAAQQNAVPMVREVRIGNPGEDPLEDVQVTMQLVPGSSVPWTQRIESIASGATHALSARDFRLSGPYLRALHEREIAELVVEVHAGDEVLATTRREVELLAANEWSGESGLPELLAAFVLPNDPALPPVIKEAASILEQQSGRSALDGYQSRDPERVSQIAAALHAALQATGVSYINPPASFEVTGQKVRLPAAVLQDGLGTCLDLTLVLCALMEQAGLHPLILIVEGHAFPGVWLTKFQLPTPFVDDPTPVRNRVRLGEALVFDSSSLASGRSFQEAVRLGDEMLRDDFAFRYVVDVAAARSGRILALNLSGEAPARLAKSGPESAVEAVSLESGTRHRYRADLEDAGPAATGSKTAGRLERWKDKLLDLTLRNRLLNYRSTRTTLSFKELDLPRLEDALAESKRFELAPKPELLGPGDPRSAEALGAMTGEGAVGEHIREAQGRGLLHSESPPAEFGKAALELYRRSKTSREESGAVTIYLGLGMLHWYEAAGSDKRREAPLILLPVDLARDGGRFYLTHAEEEPRVNVSLLKKLHDEFAIDVSSLDVLPEDDSGLDVDLILRRFTKMATRHKRWEVVHDVVLAEFSFQKFLMWLDLEANTEHLLENPVVHHIFEGRGQPFELAEPLPAMENLDRDHPPQDVLPVVSADPSQLQAVVAALDGSSFVLQGPPGTGKSQTITNLVATLLARGRSVLFVSEKMAALEVVHTRLEAVGLGPFCLELHSNKASKKSVMDQLARALESGNDPDTRTEESTLERLAAAREQLNAIAELLRRKSPFAMSNQATLARLIGLRDGPKVRLSPPTLNGLDADGLQSLVNQAEDLARSCERTGPVAEHPLRPFSPPPWSPSTQRGFEEASGSLVTAVESLEQTWAEAAELCGLPVDEDPEVGTLESLHVVARILLAGEAAPRALVAVEDPAMPRAQLQQALDLLDARRAAWEPVGCSFTDRLLKQDLDSLRGAFAQWGNAFFLFAFLMLFSTRARLKGLLLKGAALPPNNQMADLLGQAVEAAEHEEALDALEPDLRQWFGQHWQGLDSDPEGLVGLEARASEYRTAVRQLTMGMPPVEAGAVRDHLYRLMSADFGMVAPGSSGAATLQRFSDALAGVRMALALLDEQASCGALSRIGAFESLGSLKASAESWHDAGHQFRDWSFVAADCRALEAAGMAPVTAALRAGGLGASDLAVCIQRSVLEVWFELLLESEPLLRDFRGARHEALIARFQELDAASEDWAREEVVARIRDRIPRLSAPGEEMALLKHQLQLKRRHMPLRKLFSKLPELLPRLKPCVLMSPLSVAQYLDPSLPGFDVVVFDEASQIPPWDAVGAIARGDQVIIVGDSKQLPPTTFFHGGDDGEGPLDEEDRIDLDSILEEAVSSGLYQHRLRWHYRSRHESLIAFSNYQYYENKLHTFPSAAHEVDTLGVHLRPVPDGFYDRGKSRTNQAEAEAVRDEVLRLLGRPGARRTVGVVTFSMAQQRLIQDLVDASCQENPELAGAFDGEEGLFIKNLENVQGDERDIILFSIGYGPDKTGRVSMNFGPLNKTGGERRLNVAVTRARERVVLFSTLRADQLDLSRTRSIGVAHLKAYLEYAERGIAALGAGAAVDPDAEPESPFEVEVKAALETAGHRVRCQVGVSGYRIDLGVVHPDKPGTFAVGIECDGAAYHSSAVARERDHLRQLVLESLGWSIHRVWSTDWWHDRRRTEERLLAAVEEAIEAARREPDVDAEPSVLPPSKLEKQSSPEGALRALDRIRGALETDTGLEPPPHASLFVLPTVEPRVRRDDFHSLLARRTLAEQIAEIVEQAGPVEEEHAWALLREASGFGRLGRQIRETLVAALEAIPEGRRPIRARGALFSPTCPPEAFLSFRVPGAERSVDQIPLQEIANAHAWVLENAGAVGVDVESLLKASSQLLGFSQLGRNVRKRLDEAVWVLVESGRMRRDGEHVSPAR